MGLGKALKMAARWLFSLINKVAISARQAKMATLCVDAFSTGERLYYGFPLTACLLGYA